MNRALSLTRETDDKTDSKLDELLAQVDVLVCNQREQVSNMSVRLSVCAVVSVMLVSARSLLIQAVNLNLNSYRIR